MGNKDPLKALNGTKLILDDLGNNLRYVRTLWIFLIYFRDLQQRIPNELLSALATSLVEGPIFEIVSSLTEVQNVTEKQLFRERLQVLRGHSRKSNAKMILDCRNHFGLVQNNCTGLVQFFLDGSK